MTSGGPRGTQEEIEIIDLSAAGRGGWHPDSSTRTAAPHIRADLSFQPGSNAVVLIGFGSGTTMLFDPAIEPPPDGDLVPDYTIGDLPATWYGADRIMFVGVGEAFVSRPDGSDRRDIENVPSSKFPSAVSSVGENVVIGYSDGSVGMVRPGGRFMLEEPVDGIRIDDVAISPDGRVRR